MKHIPLLKITPVDITTDEARDPQKVLAVECGEVRIYLERLGKSRCQRYWDRWTRASTWVATVDEHEDYKPFPPHLITENTIAAVGGVEQGHDALVTIKKIWKDCPAVRPIVNKILWLFQ